MIPITRAQLIPKGFVPDEATTVLLDEAVELCNEVQDFVNRQCVPTSGLRTIDDFLRLKRNGYNPSVTSDHFFGLPVPVNGKTYTGAVGAVDLYIPGLRSVFLHIVNYFLTKYPNPIDRPRQLIFETSAKGNDWLHIANVPSRIFTQKVAQSRLNARPLLYSLDNGKTYQVFDPKNPPSVLSKTIEIGALAKPTPVVEKPVEVKETPKETPITTPKAGAIDNKLKAKTGKFSNPLKKKDSGSPK
jgi:hypothetical protein